MSRPELYGLPILGRYGLTHGILSWARCRLWCHEKGAQMLAPSWFKVRVGPYLRRERDKRNYFLLFEPGNSISGLARYSILARSNKIDIGPEWPQVPAGSDRPVVLRFHNALEANDRKSFSQIVGHQAFLRQELLAMTRVKYRPPSRQEPFFAIHVRLGDFSIPLPGTEIRHGSTNTRLPIQWYGNRLDALRLAVGANVHAVVFSDGTDDDLADLLSRQNVTRMPRQQSISDLLEMGQGAAVIASGSGFSMWGAFLGSAPRLSYPGQSRVPIYSDTTRDIESGFDSEIHPGFVEWVHQRLLG